MNALRTSALVMLGIAALDGTLDGVEYLVGWLTGRPGVDLWPLLLGLGLAVLVLDLLITYRESIFKCIREAGSWFQSKTDKSNRA